MDTCVEADQDGETASPNNNQSPIDDGNEASQIANCTTSTNTTTTTDSTDTNTITTTTTEINQSTDEEYEKLLQKRMQPIYELVDSERTYVSSLKLVAEKYIPLDKEPQSGIELPDDLSHKWRILWGNWLQLTEWHQNFLDRLENLLNQNEFDRIPKLFIDSKTRLRNNYSKYCENHRKAAIIAEQYRDFFEEVRIRIGDKQDVVSHLMKPVQRIMRYQLPMEGIVKCTEKANLESAVQWSKALDIMKEIPGDTQLILEAARIDGFPGTITALGKVRIRDDLSVAVLSPAEFSSLTSDSVAGLSTTASAAGQLSSQQQQQSPTFQQSQQPQQILNDNHHSTTTIQTSGGDSAATITDSLPTTSSSDSLKFMDRRLFLFDQSLLFTEELKPKKNNPFAQSTYQFKSFVNVNKMRFEAHWKKRIVTNPIVVNNSRLSILNRGASLDYDDHDDELLFVIHDISPSKPCVYIIDPGNISRREAWIVQLRDIHKMQQELLMALQDPKGFAAKKSAGCSGGGGGGGEELLLFGNSSSSSSSFPPPLDRSQTAKEPVQGRHHNNRSSELIITTASPPRVAKSHSSILDFDRKKNPLISSSQGGGDPDSPSCLVWQNSLPESPDGEEPPASSPPKLNHIDSSSPGLDAEELPAKTSSANRPVPSLKNWIKKGRYRRYSQPVLSDSRTQSSRTNPDSVYHHHRAHEAPTTTTTSAAAGSLSSNNNATTSMESTTTTSGSAKKKKSVFKTIFGKSNKHKSTSSSTSAGVVTQPANQ